MVQKVAGRSRDRAQFSPSSSKWEPFSNQGRIRQQKERDGLSVSSVVPKIYWASKPHYPYSF